MRNFNAVTLPFFSPDNELRQPNDADIMRSELGEEDGALFTIYSRPQPFYGEKIKQEDQRSC